MNKIKRVKELTEQLNQYRHEYYNLNNPSVSDSTYDHLFDKLQLLENETNYVLANSPTQNVGYEVVSKLQKRAHPTPLKSLDKTKSIDELNNWKCLEYVVGMLKADGLTVEIVYENGKLIGGYTRGNGEIGEDISHNCRTFKNLPLNIPFVGKLRIVGEAIIHQNDFENINTNLSDEEKYATPRNLVAGSVRQLSSEICSKRDVYFYAFGILECSKTLSDSKKVNFSTLDLWGINIIPYLLTKEDISDSIIEQLKNTAKENNIPIDGIVFTFDSVDYSNSLGETSHHPLHSIAYKFEDEIAETTLRSVEWNTTRTGQVNPTAIFDTVTLDNTEVSRASLHNLSLIQELKLNIGCRILVSKRNMIIPYVENNLDRNNGKLQIPEICPSCSSKTQVKNTGTANFLFCTNKQCPAQLTDRFVHFVKRDCMNIDGMGESIIKSFIDSGFLKTFDDIYNLEKYKDKIVNMEGWGIKSYNNLIESINKSKDDVKLSNFIYALGIPNIGRSASKTIAKYFNSWEEFEIALNNNFDFTVLEDFGSIMNETLHRWHEDKDEYILWEKLTCGIIKVTKENKEGNSLKSLGGLTFVVTGKLNTFANRREIKEVIEKLGGKLAGSISNKTDYLINNDINSNSSKNKNAKKLGVKIISENEFIDIKQRANLKNERGT